MGFCKKCRMQLDGSNCPICNGKSRANPKTIAISVIITGIVIMMGILIYTGNTQIDKENIDESIQKISNKLPLISDVQIPVKETANKITTEITNQLDSIKTQSEKISDTFETPPSVYISSEHIGKTVEYDGIKYSLVSVSKSKNSLGAGKTFSPATTVARDGAIFVIVTIKMENITTEIRSIPHEYGLWTLTDENGRNYKPATSDIPLHSQASIGFQLRIPSGLSDVKSFGYEVLDEDSHYKMFILGTIT